MIPIPEITAVMLIFGNTDHLPEYDTIPDKFKDSNNFWWNIVSKWFFLGLNQSDIDSFKPKDGVDAANAIRAIKAILSSFEPKHEHKTAGCAYLMSEWFEEIK